MGRIIHFACFRVACAAGALCFVSILLVSVANAGVGVGDPVEAFALETSGGEAFHFPADAAGKAVFLNFWASWCPECKIELPELAAMRKKYKGGPFILLAVNVDRKRKAADKFLKKVGLDMLVLYDNDQKIINTFAPVGIPASYLIGPDGKVEKVYFGFKEDYIEMYKRDIETMMGEIEMKTPSVQGVQETHTP